MFSQLGDGRNKVASPAVSRGSVSMDSADLLWQQYRCFTHPLNPHTKARAHKQWYLRGLNKACILSLSESRLTQKGG